jgi:hypothetical protein
LAEMDRTVVSESCSSVFCLLDGIDVASPTLSKLL